jgi:hypothetical protein
MSKEKKFTVDEIVEPSFNIKKKLPKAIFSRPDIPFSCEIRRHRDKFFAPVVMCSFEDYLPAYNKRLEDLFKYEFDTIDLFFPIEANCLMPPRKVHPRDEYRPFSVHDLYHHLHTKFVTKFSYPSDIKTVKRYLEHSPIYQKMFDEYPTDDVDDSYLLNEAKYRVREIVAENPVVRINDKNEIIDGPF